MKRILLLGILGVLPFLNAQSSYLTKYLVTKDIQAILDAHSIEIAQKLQQKDSESQKHGVWQFGWLPRYYVKYGLARIRGMELMNEVIKRCNLSSITVPDKRIYHVKDASWEESNRNYAIIIARVEEAKKVTPITLAEMKQLCTLIHETGYISLCGKRNNLKGPNYIRTPDGKFCMIDTESRYEPHNLIKGFLRMLRSHDFNTDLSPEALQLILDEIVILLKHNPSQIDYVHAKITQYLREHTTPPSWDYRGYIHRMFNDLKK
jgi:hypothetical protein